MLAAATPAAAARYSWDRSLTITRTSSDDDIRNVFRTILQANGLSVSFGPSVRKTVSFHLEGVPIEKAFERLISENQLTHSYNPATKTVQINAATAGGGSGSFRAATGHLHHPGQDQLSGSPPGRAEISASTRAA